MQTLLTPGSILSMPEQAADALIRADNGDAALVYLCLLRDGNTKSLLWSDERLSAAKNTLYALGMIQSEQTQPAAPVMINPADQTPPEYAITVITQALSDKQEPFSYLADQVEKNLGKPLNENDLRSLYTLYDHLALPVEVIMLLVGWCMDDCVRKYGQGRKPTMAQIKREGFLWAKIGIETIGQADQHLKRLARLKSREGQVLKLFQIAPRPLIERERTYIAAWDDMGFDNEALYLAYERTILKKGEMNWNYLNGILKRWHEKNLHTKQAVLAAEENKGAGYISAARGGKSTHLQKNSQQEIDRMRRILDTMKKGD